MKLLSDEQAAIAFAAILSGFHRYPEEVARRILEEDAHRVALGVAGELPTFASCPEVLP